MTFFLYRYYFWTWNWNRPCQSCFYNHMHWQLPLKIIKIKIVEKPNTLPNIDFSVFSSRLQLMNMTTTAHVTWRRWATALEVTTTTTILTSSATRAIIAARTIYATTSGHPVRSATAIANTILMYLTTVRNFRVLQSRGKSVRAPRFRTRKYLN